MTQLNNYHPCTSILIEALRNMKDGDKVLKEWDKQRQIVDKKWQAAKADIEHQTGEMIRAISLAADAREAALEREIAELKARVSELDGMLGSRNLHKEHEFLQRMSELQYHINVLREALVDIAKTNASTHGTTQMMLAHCIKSANEALTSTPALKENQFPNSANLDVYNSVVFSDGSHGTMIMESKIVKWLCRNRAKDYFDEMVEGK